jgi:hypothetical protein
MFEDPIVEDVRAIRHRHAELFGFDLQAIMADIQRQEQISGSKFVNRPHRKAITWQASIAPKRKESADRQR